ncbi:MAG: hypothetical protein HY812_12725 [Planctomycetes bacterium]|nr:hypothetical protein [Planctomycetota bacterium]
MVLLMLPPLLSCVTLVGSLLLGPPGPGGGLVQVQASVSPAEAAPGDTVTLTVTATIQDGYHFYAPDSPPAAGTPARLEFTETGGLLPEGAPRFTEPEPRWDEIFEVTIRVHEGEVVFEQTFRVPANASGTIRLAGALHVQVCDAQTCNMEDPAFAAELQVAAAAETAPAAPEPAAPAPQPAAAADGAAPARAADLQTMPLGAFLLLAVFWGAVTLLMPCTYPMIPITISFFTKQAIARQGRVLPLALAKSGLSGVFLMGATLVVTSFTCTAPFVGSLLSVGAGEGNIGRIALGMGVFGLTMAAPFALLALLPGRLRRMPQAGEWMHALKVYLGFVELAAALKFFSNADLVWGWGILSREVFLTLAVGIFFAAAAFLFGWIRLEGESEGRIGPVRMLGGVGTLLLSLYLGLGLFGFALDDISTAIIPNYSSERLWGARGGAALGAAEHAIVKDDLEGARRLALDQRKLLLLNFTGYS